MNAMAADLMKPGDPKFAADTARLVASLAGLPRKPAKRARAAKEGEQVRSPAKVTALGRTAAGRSKARTSKKKTG